MPFSMPNATLTRKFPRALTHSYKEAAHMVPRSIPARLPPVHIFSQSNLFCFVSQIDAYAKPSREVQYVTCF